MAAEIPRLVRTLALFQKRIEGDDALMQLAQQRFREAGLGAEIYADNRAEFGDTLRFRPGEEPVALHLQRGLDLFNGQVRRDIAALARDLGQHLFGLVVHDQKEVPARFGDYLGALAEIDRELERAPRNPILFVEYAAGIDPGVFVEIFRRCGDLGHVSACIDTGHIAVREARRLYERHDSQRDIFSFSPDDSALLEHIAGIQASLHDAVDATVRVVRELSEIGKPLHYHLHDAHPLSTASPFGVSDHLSFLGTLRLPFAHEGSPDLPLAFGPEGLARVIAESLRNSSPLSFSLEIHPTGEREPLGDASFLFRHWADTTNAEKMNHWLSVLADNHRLLRRILASLGDPREKTG